MVAQHVRLSINSSSHIDSEPGDWPAYLKKLFRAKLAKNAKKNSKSVGKPCDAVLDGKLEKVDEQASSAASTK
jgi:hypothetical protein